MRQILAWTTPDDHNGPATTTPAPTPTPAIGTDGAASLDTLDTLDLAYEGDDLIEALARAAGIDSTGRSGGSDGSNNGNPPDDPTGDHDSHPDDGHRAYGPPRCEHGELLLTTGHIVDEYGGPQLDETLWWCPCAARRCVISPVEPGWIGGVSTGLMAYPGWKR